MRTRIIVSLIVGLVMSGCTQNQRAKAFGGVAHESLPAGRKLINATWKDDDLWFLTRAMTSSDVAETYEFIESSSFGILNGKVVIKESR